MLTFIVVSTFIQFCCVSNFSPSGMPLLASMFLGIGTCLAQPQTGFALTTSAGVGPLIDQGVHEIYMLTFNERAEVK